MANLDGTDHPIIFKTAFLRDTWTALTRANLLSEEVSNSGRVAEPHYTTDTKQLFIHDGTVVQPVQSLDMAVTYDDSVVCNNGEVVFNF